MARQTTIFRRIVGAFVVLMLGLGGLLAVSLLYCTGVSTKANTAFFLAKDIDVQMLQARRNEKDFQIRDLRSADFYVNGKTSNLKAHEASLTAMTKAIEAI